MMTEEPSPRAALLDEIYTWLESNPRQMALAHRTVTEPDALSADIHAELKDWLTALITQNGHWLFPPLLFGELMSLSSLRRKVRMSPEPLTDADITVLYTRLLKPVEPPRC